MLSPQLFAAQQPDWPGGKLDTVVADLRSRAPLVEASSCHALRADLAHVACGDAFVVQGGECAERFTDAAFNRVRAKAEHLEHLADLVESVSGLPTVQIGRFAGQYAKPRSELVESLRDGTVVPVYRGDAVNAPEATELARRPDPRRLLLAYDHAARCIDTLTLNRCLLPAGTATLPSPVYISHEALLLDYEDALVRDDWVGGGRYASSAHMLWVGERTRQMDSAHLAFAEQITNPVGVKIGPTASAADVYRIIELLASSHPSGRLVLIPRLGSDAVASRLPVLLEATRQYADRVVWLCDPMHGNTCRTLAGQKTRVVADVLAEVERFMTILRRHGVHPGGLHIEMTSDPVTECVETSAELSRTTPLPCYLSACDPRLDPEQSARVVSLAASLL